MGQTKWIRPNFDTRSPLHHYIFSYSLRLWDWLTILKQAFNVKLYGFAHCLLSIGNCFTCRDTTR